MKSIDDIRAALAPGPTPELLSVLIEQANLGMRRIARRNNPDPDDKETARRDAMTFDALKKHRDEAERQLPIQREAWRALRLQAAKSRQEQIMARFDPAERAAIIKAINAQFDKLPKPRVWRDDMTGVRNPDAPVGED